MGKEAALQENASFLAYLAGMGNPSSNSQSNVCPCTSEFQIWSYNKPSGKVCQMHLCRFLLQQVSLRMLRQAA